MSVGSILVGTVGAYYQRGFKRFLAYSAIAHVGYILIGFSCASFSGLQSVLL